MTEIDELARRVADAAAAGVGGVRGDGGRLNQPDAPPQPDESQKTACAEDTNTLTLSPNHLRLIVITIRRALVAALKLCDQLAEQLKTK